MGQSIRSRLDRITGPLKRADVGDGQLATLVCGGDDRSHCCLADRWNAHAIRFSVIIDDLDVVRAFGYSSIYKSLGFVRSVDRRNLNTVLGAVSARSCNQRTRRKQVGHIEGFALGLLFSY